MTRASAYSAGLAVGSIIVQCRSLTVAAAGAKAAATGGQVAAPTELMPPGTGSGVALVLGLVATALASSAWTRERSPVRVSVLCLSVGAILFALVVV
jgi:hypothetical protein